MSTAETGRKPGRPRKVDVQQLRNLAVDAATRVFADVGYEAATIDRIARDAGVSRQSVYELFADKAALFDAAVTEAEERAFTALSQDALEPDENDLAAVARRAYATMFTFVADNPEVYELLQAAERSGRPALTDLRTRLAPIYAEASGRRWQAEGITPGRADHALVDMYFAMTEALVGLARSENAPDREALIDLLTEFTVGGVSRVLRYYPELIERLG